MENFFKTLKRRIWPLMGLSAVVASLLQLVSLIPIYLMPLIIDDYIPNGKLKFLMPAIAIYVGVPLLTSLGYHFYQYCVVLKGRKLVMEINLKCFDKIVHQPMRFFDENYSAEIAKKCSQEANAYICSWTVDIPRLASGGIMGAFVFVLLYRLHPLLALIQLLFLPLVFVIMKAVGGRLQALIEQVLLNNARYQKDMQESFRSIRFIKTAQLENQALERVKETQEAIRGIWGRVAFLDNFVNGISSNMLPGIFYGLTFAVAAVLAARGEITVGALTASLGYATKIHHMFDQLLVTYKELKKAKGEVRAIEEYLNLPDERDEETGSQAPWKFEKSIVFKNVHFRYPKGEREILNGVSLEFPKGEWIGVAGPSGVGKTTVLELLLRFYGADSGEILVDGVRLPDIRLSQLRKHISYVSQDVYLVEGTIRDNLLLVSGCGKEEMERAAAAAGILSSIEGGLEKQVGEGGMLLSGGEKQRVAIARCLLEGKEILLLDEASSQLDNETQEKMARLLNEYRLARGVTVISVAHRQEFHQYADRVVLVGENGSVD